MGAVFFYHLTEQPLEATLPSLLEKAMAAGWKVAVLGQNDDRLEQLDRSLWQGDGFLPHGVAGGAHDARQPVLLTTDFEATDATCLMAVDGADFPIEKLAGLDRACVLFDGADEAALDKARGQWRQVADAGLDAQYWAQEDGRWIKKAESTAS